LLYIDNITSPAKMYISTDTTAAGDWIAIA
jgi:hypothetical protein